MKDFEPSEIYQQVLQAGEEYADRKAAFETFSDNSKSVLAEILSGYLETCSSKAEAETRALASQDYKTHLRSLQDARRAFLRAQVRYDSLRMLADLRRTEASNLRAEMMLR